MKYSPFLKAGILALILVSVTIISWEMYLRHQGRDISYDDGESLWSDKRKQVYEPINKATVVIGSSRIKFDLDIPTWQNITGDQVIQLSNVGSSPRPVLDDLANDKNFKGKLLIDVTEGLFFGNSPYINLTPDKNIAYYKKETPAQKCSFVLNHALESQFVFLDKETLSLNALIGNTRIPTRERVYQFPDFPSDFGHVSFERQSYMTDKFLRDTTLQNRVKNIWAFIGKASAGPPITVGATDLIIASVKQATDKIKARGGQVMFVRTPSSGPFLSIENMGFPRQQFWNKLLASTNCPGIHFSDYPSMAHFQCPEFSHLGRPDAVKYTHALIQVLTEKGWKFSNAANNKLISSKYNN